VSIKVRLDKLEQAACPACNELPSTAWVAIQDESEPERFNVTRAGEQIGVMTRTEMDEQMTGPGIVIAHSEQRRNDEHQESNSEA
jgi:hypothetical protein